VPVRPTGDRRIAVSEKLTVMKPSSFAEEKRQVVKPSKSALSQALKIVKPEITQTELFTLIEVPVCFTTKMRYWLETYDNKPWEQRSDEERTVALQRAKELVSEFSARANCA